MNQSPRSEKRLAIVIVAEETLAEIMTQGKGWNVHTGLPADAKLVGTTYDVFKSSVLMKFEHPSFDIVRPATPIPIVSEMGAEPITNEKEFLEP